MDGSSPGEDAYDNALAAKTTLEGTLETKEGEVTAKQAEIDALVLKRTQDDASAAGAAKQVAEDAYNMA